MTQFEDFVNEIGLRIETGKNGMYVGKTKALAIMVNKIILSDEHYEKTWEEQKELIREEFYKKFPYMMK